MECSKLLEAIRPTVMSCGDEARQAFYEQKLGQTVTGKAEVDRKIEIKLHALCHELTPNYGFMAEECPQLHHPPGGDEERFWLIDPNDGTTPFQQGYRGPSISIALIENGRPILGIVYAYAARCGLGDYFEWSQDSALRRNGLYIQWQQACPIAFVSNNAELRHEQYTRQTHPLRYQPAPGIAYRLALVAAGRGQVALSLGQPRDLDLAGGHALLLGAGLDLYNKEGNPLRYVYGTTSQLSAVVGGQQEACMAMLKSMDVVPPPTPRKIPSWYVAPKVGNHLLDSETLNRVNGAVVGCFIADAVLYNPAILDCIDQSHWDPEMGQLGTVGRQLVDNFRSFYGPSGIMPQKTPGLVAVLPRLIGFTHTEFSHWLTKQDEESRQFGAWLGHQLYPSLFPTVESELYEALETTVNGAVGFVDGLALAKRNGVTDRRFLWIAAYLGARFGRNALPEGLIAGLETCRPSTAETKHSYITRPDILVEHVASMGQTDG